MQVRIFTLSLVEESTSVKHQDRTDEFLQSLCDPSFMNVSITLLYLAHNYMRVSVKIEFFIFSISKLTSSCAKECVSFPFTIGPMEIMSSPKPYDHNATQTDPEKCYRKDSN